jgi:hypothetical protein
MSILDPHIICLILSAVIIGFAIRDYPLRKQHFAKSESVLDEAKKLSDEWKDTLTKIHDLDTQRASSLINLTQRVESLELRTTISEARGKK